MPNETCINLSSKLGFRTIVHIYTIRKSNLENNPRENYRELQLELETALYVLCRNMCSHKYCLNNQSQREGALP